jgi:hypothetical protein
VPYAAAGKLISVLVSLPEGTVTPFLISFYNIFFGAGACAVIFLFARRLGFSENVSRITALAFGLATMCWCYSGWDFSEATQMFFLLAAAYYAVMGGRRDIFLASFAFTCLFMIKAVSIIYLPFFVWYIFSFLNRPRSL